MKLKKTSLLLAICMLLSIFTVCAVPANGASLPEEVFRIKNLGTRADLCDAVASADEVRTLLFYMPEEWTNKYNDSYNGKNYANNVIGVYWENGSYNCKDYYGEDKAWPGYNVTERLKGHSGVFVVRIPKDVTEVVFNNTVTGDPETEPERYNSAAQTVSISLTPYAPGEDGYGFYPDGLEIKDGMIYVCEPKKDSDERYSGAWFYHYSGYNYGIYPTLDGAEANSGKFYGGEFPYVVPEDVITEPNIKNISELNLSEDETNTYYFYAPEKFSGNVGVMWLEGAYGIETLSKEEKESYYYYGRFPGYKVTQTEKADGNIFEVKLPKNASGISFYNLRLRRKDRYYANTNYYSENTIFVVNNAETSFTDPACELIGTAFNYYGDGKYGVYSTLEEAQANNAVHSGGEFPNEPYHYDENTGKMLPGEYSYIPATETTQPATAAPETKAPVPTFKKLTPAKKANPIKVTAKTKSVKAKKLKKGKLTVKALTVKNAKGKVSYKKLSGSKKLTLTKKGRIIVRKGTKKGAYNIKVRVLAKGTKTYAAKSVVRTVKIKVK